MKNKYGALVFLLLISHVVLGQDYTIKNQNKILGSVNPSFYGFGESSKVGVVYSTEGFNEDSKIEYRSGFVNHYFEDNAFSLAIDVNSLKIGKWGYSNSQINVHYIYKAELSYDWTFNPSVSVGYGNSKLDFSSLVFEDQINVFSGSTAAVSSDPLSVNNKINYLDVGVSAVIHNNRNLFFGLNAKHLNQPENSFNKEVSSKKELTLSLQAGYEYDLNPYQNGFLPENSYLFLYSSFSKQGTKSRFDVYQEAILGNFSLGINQHINKYEGFSIAQVGTSISFYIEEIEIGANYSFDVGNKKAAKTSYNAFEIYMTFDLNPFKKNRRGDNSRFYSL